MQDHNFTPPWWLRSPHLQTIWSALFQKRYKLDYHVDTVELQDGDFIELCWSRRTSGRVVIILHGLEGSIESRNVNGLFHVLEQGGYRPVLMHFRGCGGRVNRLPRAYHSGDTGDIAEITEYIRDQTSSYPYAAVGISLGGNALLKWLGETGESNPLQRAVAISVPFRLHDAAARLDRGFSRLYRNHLMSCLREKYNSKFSVMKSPLDVDVSSLRSFFEYDDQVTAPLHGFAGVDDYYTRSSSRQFLKDIRRPTRIIHAMDDPFMYPETVPDADELSSAIDLRLSQHGGHAGFISSARFMTDRGNSGLGSWSEYMTLAFLDSDQ
jgi:predicted alpha/beta-fold hydrolase